MSNKNKEERSVYDDIKFDLKSRIKTCLENAIDMYEVSVSQSKIKRLVPIIAKAVEDSYKKYPKHRRVKSRIAIEVELTILAKVNEKLNIY